MSADATPTLKQTGSRRRDFRIWISAGAPPHFAFTLALVPCDFSFIPPHIVRFLVPTRCCAAFRQSAIYSGRRSSYPGIPVSSRDLVWPRGPSVTVVPSCAWKHGPRSAFHVELYPTKAQGRSSYQTHRASTSMGRTMTSRTPRSGLSSGESVVHLSTHARPVKVARRGPTVPPCRPGSCSQRGETQVDMIGLVKPHSRCTSKHSTHRCVMPGRSALAARRSSSGEFCINVAVLWSLNVVRTPETGTKHS